jgi:MscS family membrane protein
MKILIIQILCVFFVSLGLDLAQRIFLKRIRLKLETTNKISFNAAASALRAPASLLIWTAGLTFALRFLEKEQQASFLSSVIPYCKIGIILILTWFFLRFVNRVGEKLIQSHEKNGSHFDKTTFTAISKLLYGCILIIGLLTILQTLGISISGLLAFGGISGIALGFASKDLLANLFGSIMIYWDRPFAIGDWIRSPDRQIEGVVEQIGWRSTLIRTLDKRPLYVPNSIFTSIIVENPSRMSHRKFLETISLRHQDYKQIPEIVSDIRTMLEQFPEIDQTQSNMAYFTTICSSSLDLFVQAYTQVTDQRGFHRIKEALLLKIHEIIRLHGAEIAGTTTTLHIPSFIEFNRGMEVMQKDKELSATLCKK